MRDAVPSLSPEEFSARFAEIHPPFAPQAAAVEAGRCLFCFDAPCTIACPTHIDVPRFIKKISTGNLRGSALAILESNVLGLSCSRVCPVDVLCEGSCVMHRYNKQPIEIGRLQRHAMDYFYSHNPSVPIAKNTARGRVACIGAGPASLACAAELRRRGISVTLIDKNPLAGGLNTYGIAEYKLRPMDSLKEVELVRAMGAEFKLGVEAKPESLEKDYDAIFIGVGLGETHHMKIPGENLDGVVDAIRFIAEYKTASIKVGRRVVVIGAGNTAIDAATAARRLGAEEVHILYRRGESEMPAFDYEYEIAKLDRIEFHWNTQPVRIHGKQTVEGIECVRMDAHLEPIPGSNFQIPCEMVIPSIGQMRLVEFLSRCRGVELRDGCVAIQRETGQTANPKYFAGGDCVNGGREVVDAVADGKRAGAGIAKWLEAHHG
ncbi:MAG TPA: NAD(P)-dependent oxidoreductase [Candidatus Acidoferrales bacterium]|jgi:glutamate synthase (NADPH/NADH) small chain|nr:NAD(P)-dependent oxidoreductase [Candidatus Acidoferrales bacterium]